MSPLSDASSDHTLMQTYERNAPPHTHPTPRTHGGEVVATMAADPNLNQFYGLKDSDERVTTSDVSFWVDFSGLGRGIPILAYSKTSA